MLTREQLEISLKNHPLIQPRVETLQVAEELNSEFRNPHIVGGYLRNIILGSIPNDCDVVFSGYMLNQPGILEAVQEAEVRLGIPAYPDWEFENISATGFSGDLYEDVVGKYSYHTDYLTMLIMDTDGNLHIGEEQKTLADFDKRVYDLRLAGVMLWANHRGGGRSFESCLTGDLIRGLYLSASLNLTVSENVAFLLAEFDKLFRGLEIPDQEARLAFWIKKTKEGPKYQPILDKFGINALKTISES